jgi:hypothetical protein
MSSCGAPKTAFVSPIRYFIGPVMGWGLLAVFSAQIFYRLLQSVTFTLMWKAGRWQTIKLP